LNRCLDNAIANAVSEFAYQREMAASDRSKLAFNERLGAFAHELRNSLSAAMLALSVIRKGNLGLGGATGLLLDRSLVRLRNLIDRSLGDVRTLAGLAPRQLRFSLADFIAECGLSGTLEADVMKCTLTVPSVDPALAVDCDRDMLAGAVGNLLQNAFKFTRPGTEVVLSAYAVSDRVLIEVSDHCGGLAPGAAEELFQAFKQHNEDRTGLGLGLAIARADVGTCGGLLSVRDRPGHGCVFTIDLPRRALDSADGASPEGEPDALTSA
jgi:signal transduction histidine kinase